LYCGTLTEAALSDHSGVESRAMYGDWRTNADISGANERCRNRVPRGLSPRSRREFLLMTREIRRATLPITVHASLAGPCPPGVEARHIQE